MPSLLQRFLEGTLLALRVSFMAAMVLSISVYTTGSSSCSTSPISVGMGCIGPWAAAMSWTESSVTTTTCVATVTGPSTYRPWPIFSSMQLPPQPLLIPDHGSVSKVV